MPITSSGPATFSYSALSPAAMKMSAPCSAGAFDPDTGASRNSAPAPRTKAATALEVPASTVETSTYPFPAPRPGAAASAHASAASGVETMTKVTSEAAHASAAVAASVAPASTRGWHADAVRFHTVRVCPALIRLSAMGTPGWRGGREG